MNDQVRLKLDEKIAALVKQRDELRDQLNATEGALQALMWARGELSPSGAQEVGQDDRNPPNP